MNYLSFLDSISLVMTVVRRFIKGLTIDLSSSKNLVSMKSTLVGELSVLF